MASARRKSNMTTRKVTVIIIVVVVLVLAVIFGIRMLRSQVTAKFGNNNQDEIKSAEVTVGSISTTVTGSGTLANQEADELSIPQSVEVSEIYVDAGDNVKTGDMLASVNSTSVIETMADLQAQIDDLDEEIKDLEETEAVEKITSGVSGRVKKIYAKKDTSLATTMYDNKALMLISLDGYMAVDIETEDLKVGDSVKIVASDKTEYKGKVEAVWAGKATIILTDKGTKYHDKVTVKYDDKSAEGNLYIHEEVAVTGYTGTTSKVNVSEDELVDEGDTLLTLEDADDTVNYQTILKKREALQEELQNLIVIYKEGAVYAKADGLVTSITESSDEGATTSSLTSASSAGFGMGSASSTTVTTTSSDESSDTIIAISPTDTMSMIVSVDESQILSLSVGQEASVSIESLSDESFSGSISKIDKVGTSSSGVTTYSATIEIERTEGMLEGMTASAVITIEGKENAILVPSDAVKKTSSTAYVYKTYDEESGELKDMVEVTIGLSDGSYTEITEGLSEGETVYYSAKEEETSFDFGGFGGGMPGGGSGFGGNMPGGSGSGSGGGMPGNFGGGSK